MLFVLTGQFGKAERWFDIGLVRADPAPHPELFHLLLGPIYLEVRRIWDA